MNWCCKNCTCLVGAKIILITGNPLSPDMKMHILITDLHTFLIKLDTLS